jgi:hypothetical protein
VFGDVELVREEVALGVAEVRAVEPDIALIEEAVEEPEPGAAGPASSSKRVR